MEFRRAEDADCNAIAEMESKYIECPWSESVVRETVADEHSVIYLLESDGKLLGYGGIKTVLDTAEVYNIAVHANHRRKGYGSAILNKLISHAEYSGAREILLEVGEHNDAAVNMYRAFGFKTLYTRKNYYKSGNALVMVKPLVGMTP